jgi:hypothetical protein
MKKLKEKWGISSNFQFIMILIGFSITGSLSAYLAGPILNYIGLQKSNFSTFTLGTVLYYILRILFIFPVYQVLLVVVGTVIGQFRFFWNFEKKMLCRLGLKHFC